MQMLHVKIEGLQMLHSRPAPTLAVQPAVCSGVARIARLDSIVTVINAD